MQSVQFEFDYSAPPPLQISGFSPTSGGPGTVVNLFIASPQAIGSNYQVTLAGVLLGQTPLTRNDLDATAGAELVIRRDGFEPVRQKITLVTGKPLEIKETLKLGQKYGTITLKVKNGWGDVYLKGAKVGRAPNALRLPVGRQTLHLKNTGNPSKPIEWDVTCDVDETEQNTCTTEMP